MIAKRVKKKKGCCGIERLTRYILDIGSNEEALWVLPPEYSSDTKLASHRITGCEAAIPGLAIAEMKATQAQNTRVKGDKTYHLIISFPEGEHPTQTQLDDIEDSFCEALGFGEHQRISAVHQDTAYRHIHVAINKIHPTKLTCHEPYRDYKTLANVCETLEVKHGLRRDNHQTERHESSTVAQMRHHSNHETLIDWVKARAKLLMDRGDIPTWQLFHDALSRLGLVAKLQGAGLIIQDKDSGVSVKGSSIDKSWSLPALSKRLGAYEHHSDNVQPMTNEPPTIHKTITAKQRYAHDREVGAVSTRELFAAYQAHKADVIAKRQAERVRLRGAGIDYLNQTRAWYASRRKLIKDDATSPKAEKRMAYKTLSQRYQRDMAQHKEVMTAKRQSTMSELPVMDWDTFLMSRALGGDKTALKALQKKGKRIPLIPGQNWVTNEKHVAENSHAPATLSTIKQRKHANDHIIYDLNDGGVVVDTLHALKVRDFSKDATWLSLMLAIERFANQPLKVSGSERFKDVLVKLSVEKGLPVVFADANLETKRQMQLSSKRHITAVDNIPPALASYLEARNGMRGRVNSIDYHRIWRQEDHGESIYMGCRTLTDGTMVMLLKTKQTHDVLVKPLAHHDTKQLPKVGSAIVVDAKGVWREQRGVTR